MNVLFATSEVYPLIKTGGLGDVSASLPSALQDTGLDLHVILPAYGDALAAAGSVEAIARFAVTGGTVTLLEAILPTGVKAWLVEHPLFARPGNPYLNPYGEPWEDNAARFALFDRAVVALAQGRTGLAWRPDIVHCNDWQTGLIPALIRQVNSRPATVFTVHNLAYQGVFDYATFTALILPPHLFTLDGLEFHGQFSFMKGGLNFADRITTVSPTYAREIQTPAFGVGLDGLLRYRSYALKGILNGIDTATWNPKADPHIACRYNSRTLDLKRHNKAALQNTANLPQDDARLLIGLIGRLVEQKGIDLVLDALPELLKLPVQLIVLGTGEAPFEARFKAEASAHPDQLAAYITYDEAQAHRIEAGADALLMPSRFEPCGLNQMYSLQYGTIPIVRRVGGLADTVLDATDAQLTQGTATGIVFTTPSPEALLTALNRVLALYRNPEIWRQLQLTGMRQDLSWARSAQAYRTLYEEIMRH